MIGSNGGNDGNNGAEGNTAPGVPPTDGVLLIGGSAGEGAIVDAMFRQTYPTVPFEMVEDSSTALDFLFGTGDYAQRSQSTPVLILLNVQLSTMSSLDLLRVIKGYARTHPIPVLALASSTNNPLPELIQLGVLGIAYETPTMAPLRRMLKKTEAFWLTASPLAALTSYAPHGPVARVPMTADDVMNRSRIMPTVLIVDDDVSQLTLLRTLLQHTPYTLITAQSAAEALGVVHEQIPDVILLDVAMPNGDGLQLLHIFRADPQFAELKVILVTAVPGRISTADEASVFRVIAKPFKIEDLEEAVGAALNAKV